MSKQKTSRPKILKRILLIGLAIILVFVVLQLISPLFPTHQLDSYYAKNSLGVYRGCYWTGNGELCEKIPTADKRTFTPLGFKYAKDKNYVYFDGEIIPEADPSSFKAYGESDSFGNDIHSVYYHSSHIPNADSSTWQYVRGVYSKDAHHVFSKTTILKNADSSTFTAVNTVEDIRQNGHDYFMTDKDHVFLKDNILEKVRPEGFTNLGNGYIKNNYHVYFFRDTVAPLTLLPDVDPNIFRLYYITEPFDYHYPIIYGDGKHFYSDFYAYTAQPIEYKEGQDMDVFIQQQTLSHKTRVP
jgi:hypothetical protein